MKQFNGFPARSMFTPIPAIFFSSLVPQITDIGELKVTLFVIEKLYPKKGTPKFVNFSELLSDISVTGALRDMEKTPEQMLRDALQKAVTRGTLLTVGADNGDDVYLLNTDDNRQAVERIRSGELSLAGLSVKPVPVAAAAETPDIFTMYEANIGMLTPMIADELRDAEKNYPADWLRDAFKEAVSLNKRNWRYISRVLERWSAEGKEDGTHRRYNKENTDPDKYIKGKYGHIVQR